MENQDIMTNNEVMEVAEEFVPASSGNGLKIVGGVLAIAGLVYGGYKLVAKIEAKKEQQAIPVETCDVVDECVEEND